MYRRLAIFSMVLAIALCVVPFSVYAGPGAPNFGAAIYANDMPYGTKGTTLIPAPNENNEQSFDPLFHVLSDMGEVLSAVAVSTPGDRDYNGGRWIVYDVVPVFPNPGVPLFSYQDIESAEISGLVTIVETGVYVQCPLLPAKDF